MLCRPTEPLHSAALDRINREAIAFMQALRDKHQTATSPMTVWGSIGPRYDAYRPDTVMSADQAQAYHRTQIDSFVAAGADLATAMTVTHASEGTGIARAAAEAGLPCVISFTTETDGRLPSGQTLGAAIAEIDAATGSSPDFYMINCAHPDHFSAALEAGETWLDRLGGVRANASRLSHAELDEATELDAGDIAEFGALHRALRERYPGLTVIGGCCGTDDRHIAAICETCV
jgi:homocysteine S-methyltransferase